MKKRLDGRISTKGEDDSENFSQLLWTGTSPPRLNCWPVEQRARIKAWQLRYRERWNPSYVLVGWPDEARHGHWAWIPGRQCGTHQ